MSMQLDYHTIYAEQSAGSLGAFGIKIMVAYPKDSAVKIGDLEGVAYTAAEAVKSSLMTAVVKADPDMQREKVEQREQLLSLFAAPIFVEEIPNGYSTDWYYSNFPWFSVTTTIGRFKIGWRKRVINIDWSETRGTKTAEELFPLEKVTKGDRYIHSYDLVYARRYIDTVIASAAHAVITSATP